MFHPQSPTPSTLNLTGAESSTDLSVKIIFRTQVDTRTVQKSTERFLPWLHDLIGCDISDTLSCCFSCFHYRVRELA